MRVFYTIFLFILLPITATSQNISRLLRQLQDAKPDTGKVNQYNVVSKYYQYVEPDSAIYYANEGLKLARAINDRIGEGVLLNRLGAVNESHGNLGMARKYLEQSLKVFQQQNYIIGIAGDYNGLGIVEAKKGNLDTANNYFLKALKLNKQAGNKNGIVQSYIKLGSVNELYNNLDKALEYFNEAEKINKKLPLSDAYFTLCNELGVVYAKKGDMKKAIQYFKDGISKSDTAVYAGVHVSLLGNIGNAYDHLGDKATARSYLEKALLKTRQYDLPEDEARTLMTISTMINAQDPLTAKAYLDSALNLALRIHHKKIEADIYEAYADNYEELSDYKNAFAYLRKYYDLRDSILNNEKEKVITRLQTNYDLEESKVQIQELKLVNQERTFERNISIAIITAILAILFTLGFSLRRTYLLNKKLKESNIVKDKLFSIIGHDLKGPMAGISQMMSMLETENFTPEEQKQIHEELQRQSEASLEILNSLLNWGNIQLQGIKVNATDFDARRAIDKTISLLKSQAELKEIRVNNHVGEGVKIHADSDHFDFIVRNLLSNAIKFTHLSGAVDITAVEKDDKILFSVSDTGVGISQERQKDFLTTSINVSFGTNGEKGTGLGLLLSKEFIHSNNGSIWFDSKEGQGTTFYFTIDKA